VFPGNGSHPWRLPSLARVPVSPVPRGQQYDEGATTSRLRIPGHLLVSLPGPTRCSAVRARFGSAPGWMEYPIRARAIVQPAAHFAGVLSRGRERDLTGSQAIHPMPLPRSKTPVGPTTPRHDGVVDAAPAQPTAKAPTIIISRLLRGFGTCCLRFQNGVAAVQARLASGWLAGLCREGVEPSGSR
jgi:hypothetical protein